MEHSLELANRAVGKISGINKVVSFDTDEVILLTDEETIVIKGKDMHVTHLDVDKGNLEFEGMVNSIEYSHTKKITAKGVVGRLFK